MRGFFMSILRSPEGRNMRAWRIMPGKLALGLALFLLAACIAGEKKPGVAPEKEVAEHSQAEPEAQPRPRDTQVVMGWVENIRISNVEKTLGAKLDSGATTSSIHAEIIRVFTKNEKEHVLFRVPFGEVQETFEAPILRWVRIKTKDGKHIRRPVVEMTLCIGSLHVAGEVNLADRDHFNYPVLIGRNMLKDRILVDSSKTFLKSPSCK